MTCLVDDRSKFSVSGIGRTIRLFRENQILFCQSTRQSSLSMGVFGMVTKAADISFGQKTIPTSGELKSPLTQSGTSKIIYVCKNWDGM